MVLINRLQTTDYEYEKDGVQSSYMTISGKTLPFSNNFCPYMISTMASDARRYVDMISTEPVENYESIFTLTDNGDGTRTIVTIGETSMTYVLNAENYVIQYTDNYGQYFSADGFNAVTLDYTYSGL